MSRAGDYLAIQRVLAQHCHALDRLDLDLLRACYHQDAFEDHGPYRGGLTGLIEYFGHRAVDLTGSYHMLGTPWVTLREDRAWVISYVFSHLQYKASPESTIRGLRYLDRLEKREGGWRIARRTVVLDWENALTDAPSRPSASSWTRGAMGQDDPAVAFRQDAETQS